MHYSWHHLVVSQSACPACPLGHFINIMSVQFSYVALYVLISLFAEYYCISSLFPIALILFARMAFPPKNIWVLACRRIRHFPLIRPTPMTGYIVNRSHWCVFRSKCARNANLVF